MRGSQADKSLEFEQFHQSVQKYHHMYFAGRFKGERYKRFDSVVSTYLLGKEFGGAHMILISPAYILVNETGDDLKYTFNSSYTNAYCLETDMFTPLTLKSEPGSEVVSKILYFNCNPKR